MKQLRVTGALLLAVIGCAPQVAEVRPKRVSLLPPAVDVDALLPPVAVPTVPVESLSHFRSVPVDEGAELCYGKASEPAKRVCTAVEPGILVSEQTYAQSMVAESEAKRYKQEVATLRKLRLTEVAAVLQAETAYQDTVAELQTENARLREPTWWAQHSFEVGLMGGIVVTIATIAAASAATD